MTTNASAKIAAANLRPGMTVRVAGLQSLAELIVNPMVGSTLARMYSDYLLDGQTHRIPCGSVTSNSPTITIAEIIEVTHEHRNLRSIRIRTTTDEIVEMSTRQKVEVVA